MAEKKRAKNDGLMRAAGILVVANFMSSILGYVKNILITSLFGMGMQTDAYYAAFTIPDAIYTILVGGGISSAFIPEFSGYLTRGEKKDAYRMASTVLNLVAIVVMIFCVIGEIFAPQLLPVIVDFSDGGTAFFNLTVKLTRIMFFQCFFMCLIGICVGILQSYKKFTPSALGSISYNLIMIVVGFMLYKAGLGIAGFSIGVVTGALVDLIIQATPVIRSEFEYKPVLDIKHPGVMKFLKLFWPMLLGVSVSQLNLIVNKYFGTTVGKNTLSYMQNAQSIMQLPINILGYSIAVSIFPTMVDHFSRGEIQHYKDDVSSGIRNVVFLTLPASFGIIAVSRSLIRALYLQGRFSAGNVEILSELLVFYCIGIVGYSVRQVVCQGFYSIQETKIPVRINIFILCLNMVLSYLFVHIGGARGLALAYSVSGLTSMTLLMFFLRRKIGGFHGREILTSVVKCLISSSVMLVAVVLLDIVLTRVMPMSSKVYQFGELLILLIFGICIYVLMALMLRMHELSAVIKVLKRKFLHR